MSTHNGRNQVDIGSLYTRWLWEIGILWTVCFRCCLDTTTMSNTKFTDNKRI